MKKKITKSNPHSKTKKHYLKNPNPFIKTQLKRLTSLIDTNVTMLIFDWSGTNIGTKLEGILRYINKKWIFQFNPLNQVSNNYEKIKLTELSPGTGWEYDEDNAIAKLELEFMHKKPTFQFEFYDFDVNQVVKNKILLNYIEPKLQEISTDEGL